MKTHSIALVAALTLAACSAPTGDAGQNGIHRCSDGFGQDLRRLVFEVGAVDELLFDSLFKHGLDDSGSSRPTALAKGQPEMSGRPGYKFATLKHRTFNPRHGSRGIKRRRQPFDAGWRLTAFRQRTIDQHHIKTAWRQTGKTHQVMACGKNDAPLLGAADAGPRAAMRRLCPLTHFNKYQRAVGRAHDEVNLAAAASRRPVIRRDPSQTGANQISPRDSLGGVTLRLGGNLPRQCCRTGGNSFRRHRHRLFSGKPH